MAVVGVEHMHAQAQPVGFEVMPFINQHRAVAAAGQCAVVHGLQHGQRGVFVTGQVAVALGRVQPVCLLQFAAPLMETAHLHFFRQAFVGHGGT